MQARQPKVRLSARRSLKQSPPHSRRVQKVNRQHPLGGQVGETCAHLGAGSLTIAVAAFALASLIPHYQAQQERLQAIRLEVDRTEGRVERLRSQLHRNFDPQQTEAVMQEQTARVDPHLWPIVFLEENPAE
ncbi:MAG: hypothetical protein AAFY11_02100 [Cyanobacteria bacterium J06641_5]